MARDLYTKAADKGEAGGRANLGWRADEKGWGFAQNHAMARDLYHEGRRQGRGADRYA